MLSVHLPAELEAELDLYLASHSLSRSQVVSLALRRFLNEAKADPFLAWIGTGQSGMSTDELMRWSRGDVWNKP